MHEITPGQNDCCILAAKTLALKDQTEELRSYAGLHIPILWLGLTSDSRTILIDA